MDEVKVYDKAISHYGIKNQLVMVMEECSELSKECSKIYRALEAGGTFGIDNLAEEIADVQIITGQIQRFFGLKDKVKEQRKSKLKRLAERIENENCKNQTDIS